MWQSYLHVLELFYFIDGQVVTATINSPMNPMLASVTVTENPEENSKI